MTAPTTPRKIDDSLLALNTPDAHWQEHHEQWERDERRLYGGDAVLEELTKFDVEDATSYDLRKRTARYNNLPDRHMSLIAGHLLRVMPDIDFTGQWGKVRKRSEVNGVPSLAEILTYNCDGIGQDGTQLRTWIDGVVKRAGATGYRAVLVEMPQLTTLAEIRRRALGIVTDPAAGAAERAAQAEADDALLSTPLTEADRAAGWHPYLVEISPVAWIRRGFTEGTLDYACIREKVPTEASTANNWATEEDGLYVLVRAGYDRLGNMFRIGGWWLFRTSDFTIIRQGRWDKTQGMIPLTVALAEHNLGTSLDPTIGRSLTMELGQIAVDLMNARSEQRYNARQAAKSLLFLMGCNADVQTQVVGQMVAGSIVVAVPPIENAQGAPIVPTLQFGSNVALDTAVYTNIIGEGLTEAKEIMLTQVTSDPGSSGESKRAGFEEGVSPFITRSAGALETWVNAVLLFYGLRAGVADPATVTMPREIEIRDVKADIDALFDTIAKSELDAPSLNAALLVKKADDMSLLDSDKRADILAELERSAEQHGAVALGDYWSKMASAIDSMTKIPNMTPQGAGFLLGLTAEQVAVLRTGVPPGEVNDGTNAAPTRAEEAAAKAADARARMAALQQGRNAQAPPGAPPSGGAPPDGVGASNGAPGGAQAA
jgi:hypothetical protein